MGLFITVKINDDCVADCHACADACPVDVFEVKNGRLEVIGENEDECTLCGVCLQRCPDNCIELIKNY